jgi:hypothetical protein
MPSPQRQSRLYAVREHCKSHINMLKEEVNIMVDNPIFVAGHVGFFKEIEDKMAEMHEYEGILTILERYFDEK